MRLVRALLLIGVAACGGSAPEFQGRVPAGYGKVCGDDRIIGRKREPIRQGACGIARPVELYAVSGARVTGKPVIGCKAAGRLADWAAAPARRALRGMGEDLHSIQAIAGYACRTRNSRPGARLSEHAKGNAIDISGVTTTSGRRISVLRDWGKGEAGRALRAMHRGACGPFGVVLGPQADRFHRDHFHFDTSNFSRPYCR